MPQWPQSILGAENLSWLVLVTMLAFGLSLFVSLMRRGLGMAKGKKLTVAARLVARECRPPGPGEAKDSCVLVFETGGIVLRFSVSRRQYDQAQGKRKGRLTYQGGDFIRFE